MTRLLKLYIGFTLSLLMLTLIFGVLSSFAFLYPEFYNKYLPFYQLRPIHVSAALFWIISGANVGILYFKKEVFDIKETIADKLFVGTWIGTVAAIFVFYAFKKFGGREYWEFPPFLCLPIFIAWVFNMYGYFSAWKKRTKNPPAYVWMWSTGIIFFMITFLEQNLYQIAWFRNSFLREVTVQWKSNGAMVGAWNQMIYGTSLYIMTKLSGDERIARTRKVYLFYFIGVGNLMLNWGHHIYNLPAASFIRHIAYAVSMTEWVVFISICIDFRKKLHEARRFKHLLCYRFLGFAESWVYLNLLLALLMSIPALNRYTHGTHVTVAHAMGATIGINTMILLSSLGYILKIDSLAGKNKRTIKAGFVISYSSLLVFWLALLVAGLVKGYRSVVMSMDNFQEMMSPVLKILHVFSFAGVSLFIGMAMIVWNYLKALQSHKLHRPVFSDAVELNIAASERTNSNPSYIENI